MADGRTDEGFMMDQTRDFSVDPNLEGAITDVAEDLTKSESKADEEAKREREREIILERQKATQEAANARREAERARQAAAEAEAVRLEADRLRQENEELEQRLRDANVTVAQKSIPAIDPEAYEEGSERQLAASLKAVQDALAEQNAALKAEVDGLKKKAQSYEADVRAGQIKSQQDERFSSLLTDLDGDYGSECRNGAVEAFKSMWNKGEVPRDDNAKATRILEKCYKSEQERIRAEEKRKAAEGPPADVGSGGGSSSLGESITSVNTKNGDRSLDEVLAQTGGQRIYG